MVADAEKYREQDRLAARRSDAVNTLELYCHRVKTFAANPDSRTPENSAALDRLLQTVQSCELWIADIDEATTYDDIDDRMHDLEEICDPIMESVYAANDPSSSSSSSSSSTSSAATAEVRSLMARAAVTGSSSVRTAKD
jgi:heat shock protein 5